MLGFPGLPPPPPSPRPVGGWEAVPARQPRRGEEGFRKWAFVPPPPPRSNFPPTFESCGGVTLPKKTICFDTVDFWPTGAGTVGMLQMGSDKKTSTNMAYPCTWAIEASKEGA